MHPLIMEPNVLYMRNFRMVGKNMDHPSGEIKQWKNRRYLCEST